MPADPKIVRELDKKYLEYIRSQSCLIRALCYGDVDCHHSPSVGSGGSDLTTIPLCRKHHSEAHQAGVETFQNKYGVNFDEERVRLLKNYIILLNKQRQGKVLNGN